MEKFTKQNGQNIRLIFEEKTGVDLSPKHHTRPQRSWKLIYVAAVLLLVMATTVSCTKLVFSPLRGDELALAGHYEGNGVVTVTVTNGSDRALRLQEKTKLMSWITSEEVPRLDGRVQFKGNTDIAPNSSEIIQIDLSEAYDIPSLEEEVQQVYYLLLTNQDFLFGHDWMCSFKLGEQIPETTEPVETAPIAYAAEEGILQNIEPELRAYFEDSYWDEAPAFEKQHFAYQDKVSQLLLRLDGNLVRPADPWLVVNAPEEWVGLTFHESSSLDGYHRLVGSDFGGAASAHALILSGRVFGSRDGEDGGAYIPLIYLSSYPKADIHSKEDYAFIYGQLVTFAQLESCKVFENEQYVTYEVTDLFYTDLEGYLDDCAAMRQDVSMDETARQRLRDMYTYYKDRNQLSGLIEYYEGASPVPFVPAPSE